MGPPTTESANPLICVTRTRMAWSSTVTNRAINGRALRTVNWQCIRGRSIWRGCSAKPFPICRLVRGTCDDESLLHVGVEHARFHLASAFDLYENSVLARLRK